MSHSTQKNVIFLITKSNFGGAQKYVYELACAAKAQGHSVTVACGGTGENGSPLGLLAEKLTKANIRVQRINHFMRNMSIMSDLLAFFEVLTILRTKRPDVLHVTSSKAGGIGALAGRLCGVPRIIFTSHGLTVDEIWRPRWQRALIYVSTWLTLSLAHASIMISKETFTRASAMPLIGSRIHYIHNGVSLVDFDTKEVARENLALHIPPGHVLIGGIGELHKNKNWHIALQTLTTLPLTTHLAIIGSGEEYDSLSLHIEKFNLTNRVHLLGYVPDAAQYLKAFDIFLLPSLKEGLPYVILEAGLAGIPVVASDLPGIRDIIESGTHGLLVDPTPTMLGTVLAMLLRDDGMRRRLSAALQERVMNEFSIQRMNEATFALYDSSRSRAS
jgi:glycosyltransferase involved in cell wall biosynthesis